MRRILAIALLALAAATGLPAAAHAGGPTSVLVAQPGVTAAGLYYTDEAYDALLRLLPTDETRGKELPPGGGVAYTLTWMVHDVVPWRFDHVSVHGDGTAWVATTFSADAVAGWEQLEGGPELARLLSAAMDDEAAPPAVAAPASEVSETMPLAAPAAARTTWFSLTGWRWLVPGGLLGLFVGAVAARRSGMQEPRRAGEASGAAIGRAAPAARR